MTDVKTKEENAEKHDKLGSGARFKALKAVITKDKSVENPAAVAASVGRKKFGAKRMAVLSKIGKK